MHDGLTGARARAESRLKSHADQRPLESNTGKAKEKGIVN